MQIGVDIIAILVYFYFGTIFFILLVYAPLTFIFTTFTPRVVMENYFREPYFTLTETYMLRQFPGSFFRTNVFGWSLLIPRLSKKRGLDKMRGNVPKWFEWGLRFSTFCIAICIFNIVTLFPILWFSID